MSAGPFLALLLWLVLTPSQSLGISLLYRLGAESVVVFSIAADRDSSTLSRDQVHYRKERIELIEVSDVPFAFSSENCAYDASPLLYPSYRGEERIKAFPLDGERLDRGETRSPMRSFSPSVGERKIMNLSAVDSSTSGVTRTSEPSQSAVVRDFENSLARVQPLLERYGYGAAFAAVMAEGMGIPTPGQTLLVAGALEAAEGRMSIALLLVLVIIAAVVGNSVGYVIGRWGGRAALEKLKVNPARQQRFDDLFKRRGGMVILLARFLDGFRQLNGIVAGVLRMPWWTFTAYNVAGAILWTCAWGLGSYYLGRDIHFIAAFFHRHRLLLLALGAAAFVALVVYLLRSRGVSSER